MAGIHKQQPDYQKKRDNIEAGRIMLSKDQKTRPDIKDRQTITDIHSEVSTGLDRFRRRFNKYSKIAHRAGIRIN